MNLIQIIIISLVIFFVMRFLGKVAEYRRQSNFEDQFEQWLEGVGERLHMVTEEQHQDITYWFDDDNKKFLAQGKDLQEIISVLKSRFPLDIFLLNGGQHMLVGPQFEEVLDVADFIPKQYIKLEQ